ncbi:clustered mitochondria-domain-containing protein [Phlyctochytrium arcticum]|nr:clustered mitochondria-domain-containing protein [Phlyctochytrium arcticum]
MTTSSATRPVSEEQPAVNMDMDVTVDAEQSTTTTAAAEVEPLPLDQPPTFELTIRMPEPYDSLTFTVNSATTIQDLRQVIFETPGAEGYTCFHLSYNQTRLHDLSELGQIEGFGPEEVLELVPGEYNEREVRVHLTRFRETVTNFGSFGGGVGGIDYGATYLGCVDLADKPGYAAPTENGTSTVQGGSKKKANGKDAARKTGSDNRGVKVADALKAFDNYDFERRGQELLGDFVPPGFGAPETVKCLASLSLSAWNPPPLKQVTRGDLVYLRVQTLEHEVLHVTAHVNGFFVNESTDHEFGPGMSTKKPLHKFNFHTLMAAVSSGFASGYARLLTKTAKRNPLEYIVTSTGANPWLVKSRALRADPGRTLDVYFNAAEQGDILSSRDWNDDLQSTRDLPQTTPQERVLRDQAVYRTHTEFVEAATRGAIAVVSGSVMPLNPMEPESTQMYFHNNIFFSEGYDQREAFENLGGAEAAHVAVSKDVDGVRILSNLGIEGLHTLGTSVIDFRGRRIVGQTVIPGILSKRASDADSLVKYGSVDLGKEIYSDSTFHELASKVAQHLHMASHTVVDANGTEHTLYTSVDTKGIMGTDGRRYLLDLYRITPVDVEFLEEEGAEEAYPHQMVLLRPELVDLFYEHKLRVAVEMQREEAAKESKAVDEKKDVTVEKEGESKEGGEGEVVVNGDGAEEESDAPAETAEEEDGQKLPIVDAKFNVDIHTAVKTAGPEDEIQHHKNLAREASAFLRTSMIQRLVIECVYQSVPIDDEALTRRFHSRGVNMRYLGKAVESAQNQAERVPNFPHVYFSTLCKQEMVARAAKRVLRELLNASSVPELTVVVAHVLNCLFMQQDATPAVEGSGKIPAVIKGMTPLSLRTRIRKEVLKRFRYDLGALTPDVITTRRVPLLRSICKKVGLQLEAKNYDWDADWAIFTAADVVHHYPIVKTASPRASFAEEAMEHAHMSMAQDQLGLGIELFQEAAAVYEQVYGPVHPDTARAYSALATAYYQNRQLELAVAVQRKAVVVSERSMGVDDSEALQNYMNLAYFEYSISNSREEGEPATEMSQQQDRALGIALTLMRHALNLWEKLCAKTPNLESASTDANMGAMLQRRHDFATSNKFYERASENYIQTLGKEHQLTGASFDALVKGYILAEEFKKAIGAQKLSWEFLRQRLGEGHERVVQAEGVLKSLTARAVSDARKSKEQSDKLRSLRKHTPQTPAAEPIKTYAATLSRVTGGSKGSLSIDELVKYIGDEKKGKGKKTAGGRG